MEGFILDEASSRKYLIQKKLGAGSFGTIYRCLDCKTGMVVAIKREKRREGHSQLRNEYGAYRIFGKTPGIPAVYGYFESGEYNHLVLEVLGLSLEEIFDRCGRRFSGKTVAMLAKQMITRIQFIHEKGLIFRDIKPDNFLLGKMPADKTLYLTDFGMAKYYINSKKRHIPYRENKNLSGTARYMSINTHLGREQSRRDDMEALGHVIIYFLMGCLPWQGQRAETNKQKYEKILEKKQKTSIVGLCGGIINSPALYLIYTRELGFEEAPDYDYLRGLFDKMLVQAGEVDDGVYDWDDLQIKHPGDKLCDTGYRSSPYAAARNDIHEEEPDASMHGGKAAKKKSQTSKARFCCL